jgi:hypothetical protein
MKPTRHKTKPSFADIPPNFLKCYTIFLNSQLVSLKLCTSHSLLLRVKFQLFSIDIDSRLTAMETRHTRKSEQLPKAKGDALFAANGRSSFILVSVQLSNNVE